MHQILFDNVENDWHNALPLGNGRMGAMVYYKDNALYIALNHYDCYYQLLPRYTGEKAATSAKPGERYQNVCSLWDEAKQSPQISRDHYNHILHNTPGEKRPQYSGTSHPMGGEIVIHFSSLLKDGNTKLHLLIEEARVEFTVCKDDIDVSISIVVPKTADGLLCQIQQSQPDLLLDAKLIIPSTRGLEKINSQIGFDEEYMWIHSSCEGFFSETALYVPNSFQITAALRPKASEGMETAKKIAEGSEQLMAQHQEAWKAYWRSHVSLPDQFLETLWYLHVYLVECDSGRNGRYFEQARGLNGLWDIRRPSMWGSMWYWDVNIQEAFWHVFTANHLEQAEDFCNAYLEFIADGEKFARDVYGMEGMAIDYPHLLYNCIQPWTAQFLWNYYAYSCDMNFLEQKAYPVFQKQILFIKQIAKKDESGIIHIEPDISPEQGPITRDSVITIASIKQLLVYAMKAAEILSRPKEEIKEMQEIYSCLPSYPITTDGSRWKDSWYAGDNLVFRHPSLLMPMFPAEEINRHSQESQRQLAWNTLRFAANHTELGVFGGGWLAMAAARMGEGGSALSILYQQGIDLYLHSNGLGYEETERWINFCVITKPALYWPAMSEPSGGIVGTINEMLLQSTDGIIEVFPALPDGKNNLAAEKEGYFFDDLIRDGTYPPWVNCSFQGLLAQGGFEVSAQRRNGKTTFIRIQSKAGGILRLIIPPELSEEKSLLSNQDKMVVRDMKQGEIFTLGSLQEEKENKPGVQMREAAGSHRRVFLGEDRHTAFYKALDSMVCDFGFANVRRPQWTQYVFDFGDSAIAKNYDNVYRKQHCYVGGNILYFGGPRLIGGAAYSPSLGYGFSGNETIEIIDRGAPDDLRRDFLCSDRPVEFSIELPAGKYDMLLISGDEQENSQTFLSLPQYGNKAGGQLMRPGFYQCTILPVMHEGGILRIELRGEEGCKWKLNAMIVNKLYGLL